jgi:hypothetical protein
MIRFLATLAILALSCLPLRAQNTISTFATNNATAVLPGCSYSKAFFNRPDTIANLAALAVSGQIVTNILPPVWNASGLFLAQADIVNWQNAITTVLCTLVNTGDLAHMDMLYWFAAPSTALAYENLIGPCCTLTVPSPTLVGLNYPQGINNSATGYYDTGVNVNTLTNFGAGNGAIGLCFTNYTETMGGVDGWGVYNGSTQLTYSQMWSGGAAQTVAINATTFPASEAIVPTPLGPVGEWTWVRNSTSQVKYYLNASLLATQSQSSSATLPAAHFTILAANNNGTIGNQDTNSNYSNFWIGNNQINVTNVYNALHAGSLIQGLNKC